MTPASTCPSLSFELAVVPNQWSQTDELCDLLPIQFSEYGSVWSRSVALNAGHDFVKIDC